jgi:hypothetical protein
MRFVSLLVLGTAAIVALAFAANKWLALPSSSAIESPPSADLEPRSASRTWSELLPADVQASLLWSADHEEGTLFDWQYDEDPDNNGGGIFTTGTETEAFAKIVETNPFSGRYCAQATIRNAIRSRNGNKAVRLMRWTDKPWDQDGGFFPKKAYFGVWMRIDRNYSPRNLDSSSGGWWNVFQFKSKDDHGDSQPVWALNIGNESRTGRMHFYLYSQHNRPSSISQTSPRPIPVDRWFHVEAWYVQSQPGINDGSLSVWQDGHLILAAKNVKTILAKELVWGIGNYTDHITGGEQPGVANIFFDDATVSTMPTHQYVNEVAGK